MRIYFIIILLLITLLRVYSQEQKQDSTIWTFTVNPSTNEPCNPTPSMKFRVIKSDYKKNINFIFVLKNDLHIPINESATYIVKGIMTTSKEWLDECFSSRIKGTRIYIKPVNPEILIRKKEE